MKEVGKWAGMGKQKEKWNFDNSLATQVGMLIPCKKLFVEMLIFYVSDCTLKNPPKKVQTKYKVKQYRGKYNKADYIS